MYMFKFSIIYLKYLFVHKVLSNEGLRINFLGLGKNGLIQEQNKKKKTLAVSTYDYDNWRNKT